MAAPLALGAAVALALAWLLFWLVRGAYQVQRARRICRRRNWDEKLDVVVGWRTAINDWSNLDWLQVHAGIVRWGWTVLAVAGLLGGALWAVGETGGAAFGLALLVPPYVRSCAIVFTVKRNGGLPSRAAVART